MSTAWEEIQVVRKEGRHEIHLTGASVSSRLDEADGQLPAALFKVPGLNYIEVTETTLTTLGDGFGNLTSLINLALHRNAISSISSTAFEKLDKLKFLDLSFNQLEQIPEQICALPILHTFNLGNNQIASLPDFSQLKQLGKLFLDHNELTSLPEGIYTLPNLQVLHAQGNEIESIGNDISQLIALKILDMSENRITELPVEFSECLKLKEMNLKQNPIKDNRLKKMINQCAAKSVMEYVASHSGQTGKGKGGKGKKKGGGKDKPEISSEANTTNVRKMHILHHADDERRVVVQPSVVDLRPYIVVTIVRNLDLSEPVMFKKFLSIQTKLHENECEMRVKGTIATHSLDGVKFPLTYEALPAEDVKITALGKSSPTSASELIDNLKTERDELKQKKKRQPKTGLYKFIELVDGAENVCCLRNSDGDVISFPPITNSEQTKISPTIADVLIEVTSPVGLPFCKSIMANLLKQMFTAGFQSKCEMVAAGDEAPPTDSIEADATSCQKVNGLVLEQLRVTDHEWNMKVVYPSTVDLGDDDSMLVSHLKNLTVR